MSFPIQFCGSLHIFFYHASTSFHSNFGCLSGLLYRCDVLIEGPQAAKLHSSNPSQIKLPFLILSQQSSFAAHSTWQAFFWTPVRSHMNHFSHYPDSSPLATRLRQRGTAIPSRKHIHEVYVLFFGTSSLVSIGDKSQ